MILKIFVNDQAYEVTVPKFVMQEGEEFFKELDSDLNKGYQMSRTWVDSPDIMQRCQIAADKILTALENSNEQLGMMMAGYILTRMPEVTAVYLDTEGNMLDHDLVVEP